MRVYGIGTWVLALRCLLMPGIRCSIKSNYANLRYEKLFLGSSRSAHQIAFYFGIEILYGDFIALQFPEVTPREYTEEI